MNESLNPVWNQTFDFVVEDGLHDMLIAEVWDHDTFGKVRHHSIIIIAYFSRFVLLDLTSVADGEQNILYKGVETSPS